MRLVCVFANGPASEIERLRVGLRGRRRKAPRSARYSVRTLYRRVRQVVIWQRPKLTARGDPARDQAVAGIIARMLELPRRPVVCAEDETHLHLLPHVRASWPPRGARPKILTQGKNRQVTVLGAIEVATGTWVCRLGCRCAADFIALLQMLAEAFPAPGNRGDLR